MTYASRIASEGGRRAGYAVVVQGTPFVAVGGAARDLATPIPTAVLDLAWPWPTAVFPEVEVVKLEQARKTLDLRQRRMIGGSLTVSLIDDEAGTLERIFASRSRHTARQGEDIDTTAAPAAMLLSSTARIEDPNVTADGLGRLYIGAETVLIDQISSATEVSVIGRGSYGSRAQRHLTGEPVFNQPPSWLGRRVVLIGFFVEDDGTILAGDADVLDTFELEAPPVYTGPGQWELRAAHLSDLLAARRLGVGLRDVEGMGFELQPGATADQQAFVAAYGTSPFTLGAYPTFIRLDGSSPRRVVVSGADASASGGGERVSIHEIVDIDGADVVFRGASEVDGGRAERRPASARHIAILRNGSPGVLAAIALSSALGDGANGTYDVLPGVQGTTLGADDWRFGAAIPSTEIDINAFIDVGWAAPWWTYVIDDEVTVGDFLRDFCIVTESFWFVTAAGQLSVSTLARRAAAPTVTITDIVGAEPVVVVEEEAVTPRVRLTCSYNAVTREHEESVTIIDVEMAARYPGRDEVIELESGAIHIAPHRAGTPRLGLPQLTIAQVEAVLRRLMVEDRRGRAVVRLATHLDAIGLELGDVVGLEVDLPDLAGGDLSAAQARVLGIRPDLDRGELHLDLQVLDRSFAIAPAAVIASVAGFTLTLRTTGPEVASAAPARMFGTFWLLRIHDISAGTSELVYGSVTGDTTILLGALPTFTIEDGVDYITVADQAERDFADANTSGLTPDDFAYQMPDDEVDGVDEFPTRWG